jgi:hypothetical protein
VKKKRELFSRSRLHSVVDSGGYIPRPYSFTARCIVTKMSGPVRDDEDRKDVGGSSPCKFPGEALQAAICLATGTTGFVGARKVWVFNTGSAQSITVRNADDDANIGTIYVGAGAGIVVRLEAGQGLRGATNLKGTDITNSGT